PFIKQKHNLLDGTVIHVGVQAVKFNFNGNKGVQVIVRNLSENIRLEEAFIQLERDKNIILDSISEIVVYLDTDMKIIWNNNKISKQKGLTRDQVVGHYCYEIWMDNSNGPCVECPVVKTMQTGNIHRGEQITPDGIIWEITAYPVFGINSNIKGVVEIAVDITEKKNLEKKMERLERLHIMGEMAAGIGHEIRNPMATVRGFLQILGGKEECNMYKSYFDLMIEELDRVNDIITEYLSFAKNKSLDLKRNSLNSLINTLFPLLQADAMQNNKTVYLELGDISEILMDPKEIRQLILNLVRNGLEAMDEGQKLIIKTLKMNSQIVLAVQDEGKGIAPEILNKIGDPFFTTKEKGTGLGLSICQSIAQRHNAKINIDSSCRGTTISVVFRAQ
ncbi:MAG: ATP-binding protein, partial [Eubacteriales bacterium]